jgi:hypothetical protein
MPGFNFRKSGVEPSFTDRTKAMKMLIDIPSDAALRLLRGLSAIGRFTPRSQAGFPFSKDKGNWLTRRRWMTDGTRERPLDPLQTSPSEQTGVAGVKHQTWPDSLTNTETAERPSVYEMPWKRPLRCRNQHRARPS